MRGIGAGRVVGIRGFFVVALPSVWKVQASR